MTRVLATVALMIGCAACTIPEETQSARQAVQGGSPAPDDAAAVAISLRTPACSTGPGAVVCSGLLVSDQVVLTAGHCAEPYDGGRIEVWTAPSATDPEIERSVVIELQIHPQYTDDSSAFDAAVLHLESPLAAAPWPLLTTPMDATWVGRTVRVIGFGEAGPDGVTGERRSGTAVITEVLAQTFTLAPDPGLTCRGDSGGPVLADVDGIEHVIGVTSAGDTQCDQWAAIARVDTFASDFVQPAVEQGPSSEPTIDLSETCDIGEPPGTEGCSVVAPPRVGSRATWAVWCAWWILALGARRLRRASCPRRW